MSSHKLISNSCWKMLKNPWIILKTFMNVISIILKDNLVVIYCSSYLQVPAQVHLQYLPPVSIRYLKKFKAQLTHILSFYHRVLFLQSLKVIWLVQNWLWVFISFSANLRTSGNLQCNCDDGRDTIIQYNIKTVKMFSQ